VLDRLDVGLAEALHGWETRSLILTYCDEPIAQRVADVVRLGHPPLGRRRVGAYAKSMNLAGVPLMSDTRHRMRCSRGSVFLALATPTLRVTAWPDGPATNAAASI
jgi:hypothetical protein